MKAGGEAHSAAAQPHVGPEAERAFGRDVDGVGIGAVLAVLMAEKGITGIDTLFDDNSDPDFTFKREGGQLLLIRVPATVAE